MGKNFLSLLIMAATAVLLQGCAATRDLTTGLVPAEAHIQPYSLSGTISAATRAEAMKVAIAVASANDWVPKTISHESGYLFALRTKQPLANVDINEVYKLEVYLPQNGKGEVNIRVAPPKNIVMGSPTEPMASEYLAALQAALPHN